MLSKGTGLSDRVSLALRPSPFPGMDPYLEHSEIWPGVHLLLIVGLAESLYPQLRRADVRNQWGTVAVNWNSRCPNPEFSWRLRQTADAPWHWDLDLDLAVRGCTIPV